MGYVIILLLWAACPGFAGGAVPEGSYLYRPAFSLDDDLRPPAEPYVPQPGDIFLATDRARWARAGHWFAGGAGVHHSGIVFLRSDGRPALIEAGPFNSITVEVMDPIEHMREHVRAGDKVWVRRRRVPLTPEQCARLTAFAERQEGKPFAVLRLLGQVTPLRSRGPIRTWFVGKPHGERDRWFCSELVTESCVAAGLMDATAARPAATYPRDLFFGRSLNWYLNTHLCLDDWDPPARWAECQ
ncbi:MAG TPA: hypothetical protein VFA26_20335 [Gemmataceae bacterium]|nr:hypothetical protein [Gemmataceae bacterium]